MTYTKRVEIYHSTETVIYDESGREVMRIDNNDAQWYDTSSVESLSDEDAEEYL